MGPRLLPPRRQQTFDRLDDLVEQADTRSERSGRVAGAFGDVVGDLAAALGRADEVHLDGVVAREMLVGMQPMDEMLRSSGHYGAKVEVGDDASTQEALLAFTGRDPHWRPPAAP